MSSSCIIITAADDKFLSLTVDLINSIRASHDHKNIDIGVIDVGLKQTSRQKLTELGVLIKEAGVDIEYPGRTEYEQALPFIRAMTSRPFIPKYFPGYQVYVWMDSDTWLQNGEMLNQVIPRAMGDNALYISAEFDRDYSLLFASAALWQVHFNWYKALFPIEIANKMSLRPMLNSGVFALSANSPVWKIWQKTYSDVMQNNSVLSSERFMADQLSLNVAVYTHDLPKHILPAEYNWLCLHRLPMLDSENGFYVRPGAPNNKISVLHLAGDIKNLPQKICTTDGKEIEATLTYPARSGF